MSQILEAPSERVEYPKALDEAIRSTAEVTQQLHMLLARIKQGSLDTKTASDVDKSCEVNSATLEDVLQFGAQRLHDARQEQHDLILIIEQTLF